MRDLGLLAVRAPAGLLLAAHGAQKVFGWFGGGGRDGTGAFFEALGYPRAKDMATVAGLSEIGAGLGLAAGMGTPLAAAGVVGVMTNASVAAHGKAGLWSTNGGYEYPLVLATLASGIAIHGPGAISVDAALGQSRPRLVWSLGAIGLGLASAAAVLSTRQVPAAPAGS